MTLKDTTLQMLSRVGLAEPIQLAESKKPPAPPLDEIGTAGLQVFGGVLLSKEDYNPDLTGQAGYRVYDKMRNDGTVGALLRAIQFPLLSVAAQFEPASDEERDVELAEALNDNLEDMTTSWPDTRRAILKHLLYGVMPFEVVLEKQGDQIRLRKLAPRPPATVTEWLTDDHGGPKGIKQYKGGSPPEVTIPIERLLAFVNAREGPDIRGRSILREAYKDWWYKDGYERVAAIAVQRRASGVDVVTVEGTSGDQDEAAERAAQTVRVTDRMFFKEVPGVTYRIQGVEGSVLDPLPWVQHHARQILETGLAQFLQLGDKGTSGAWAVGVDHSSLFLMALKSVAENIDGTFNRYLTPNLAYWNWGIDDRARIPKMRHGKLDTRNVKEYVDAAVALLQTGRMDTLAQDIETAGRELLGLPDAAPKPEKSDAGDPEALLEAAGISGSQAFGGDQISLALDIVGQVQAGQLTREQGASALAAFLNITPGVIDALLPEKMPKPMPEIAPAAPNSGNGNGSIQMASEDAEPARLPSLGMIDEVGVTINFQSMQESLDTAVNAIVKVAQDVQLRQIDDLIRFAAAIIRSGKLERLVGFEIRYVDELADAIEGELRRLYDAGRVEAANELGEAPAPELPEATAEEAEFDSEEGIDWASPGAVAAFLAGSAALIAFELSERLRPSFTREVQSQAKRGAFDGTALNELLSALSDSEIQKRAYGATSEALNAGRRATHVRHEDVIDFYLNSEVMDSGTCGPCRKVDGRRIPADQPEELARYAPYEGCDGRERCRGILIAVRK